LDHLFGVVGTFRVADLDVYDSAEIIDDIVNGLGPIVVDLLVLKAAPGGDQGGRQQLGRQPRLTSPDRPRQGRSG
jgi:hypothetical protein